MLLSQLLPVVYRRLKKKSILYVVYLKLWPHEAQCGLHANLGNLEYFKWVMSKKSRKVLNKDFLPCPKVILETSLRRMCPFYLYSNTTKHRGTRVKKLCTEQGFDSRNCQIASLLCYMRSPGGLHKHLFPIFAATISIQKSTDFTLLTEYDIV